MQQKRVGVKSHLFSCPFPLQNAEKVENKIERTHV